MCLEFGGNVRGRWWCREVCLASSRKALEKKSFYTTPWYLKTETSMSSSGCTTRWAANGPRESPVLILRGKVSTDRWVQKLKGRRPTETVGPRVAHIR